MPSSLSISNGPIARLGRAVAKGIRLPVALGALSLAAYGLLFADPYDVRILTVCGVFALLVIGFQFIFGHAGAVSLAQATFFGLGAYVTGVLGATYDFGFLLTFPLSCLIPALLALIIAVPVLKLEEHYFALATLGIGLVVVLVAVQWQEVTGGTNGLPGVPSVRFFEFEIRSRVQLFMSVWALVALGALVAYQVTRGLYGRVFYLVRESQAAASCLGIDVECASFRRLHLERRLWRRRRCLDGACDPGGLPRESGITGDGHVPDHDCDRWPAAHCRRDRRRHSHHLSARILPILENTTLMAYGAVTLLVLIAAPYGLIGAIERLRAYFFPEPAEAPPPIEVVDLAPLSLKTQVADLCWILTTSRRVSAGSARSKASVCNWREERWSD